MCPLSDQLYDGIIKVNALVCGKPELLVIIIWTIYEKCTRRTQELIFSSASISSLLGLHLSCNSLSSDFSMTSVPHHSPQDVKKICSGFSGKSFLVNALRMLRAPVTRYSRQQWYALSAGTPATQPV